MLGGLWKNATAISSGKDLNDYKTTGVYTVEASTGISNCPPDGGYFILEVIALSNNKVIQRAVHGSSSWISTRSCWSGTWSSWQRLDNFGCNTPADLASLLGGLSPFNMERGEFNTSKTFDENHSGLLMLRYDGGNDVFVWIIDKWAVKNLGKENTNLFVTVSGGIVTVSTTTSLSLKYALIKI